MQVPPIKDFDIKHADEKGVQHTTSVNHLPDLCPLCAHKVSPNFLLGVSKLLTKSSSPREELQLVFRCVNHKCLNVFIAYYERDGMLNRFMLESSEPTKYTDRQFSNTITSFSKDFARIYNQAYVAERVGLDMISGGGYRKALEFLIKDYLIADPANSNDVEQIKRESLSDSIQNRIADANLKAVAQRAAWLGNDEVHYLRKWEKQELKDLKALIDLTIHWIEASEITARLIESMPDNKTGEDLLSQYEEQEEERERSQ